MRIFVLTATYELRVSRKSHLRHVTNLLCRTGLEFLLLDITKDKGQRTNGGTEAKDGTGSQKTLGQLTGL